MQKKTNSVRKSNRSTTKLSTKDTIIGVLIIALLLVFAATKHSIVNFPPVAGYTAFGFVFIIGVLFSINKARTDNSIPLPFRLFIALVISVIASFIVLIPFNIYVTYTAKKNAIEKVYVKIESVYTKSGSGCVYYSYKGESNKLNGYTPIMDEIEKSGKYDNYRLVLQIHRALFGAYILDDWQIVKQVSGK